MRNHKNKRSGPFVNSRRRSALYHARAFCMAARIQKKFKCGQQCMCGQVAFFHRSLLYVVAAVFWRAGGLHRRQKGGPKGCGKGRSGLQKRAALRPDLFRRPAYCAARQPADPSCNAACRPALLCSSSAPQKNQFFHLATRSSRPPGPPFSVILFSPMKEHAVKFRKCRFSKFYSDCPQNSACVFSLEETV